MADFHITRRQAVSLAASVILATASESIFAGGANAASNSDISHGTRHRPQVALTFHGAGDVAIARELLAISKSTGTPITVMAVGSWLNENPLIGKEILVGGNEIGNHTLSHLTMTHLTLAQATKEISLGKAALKKATGSTKGYFRPSGTPKSNAIIRKAALANGYKNCITYDVDTLDYQDPSPAAIVSNCLKAARNGSIISLHFGHANTVKALPAIIAGLKKANLAPVTLSTLLA